MRKLVLIAVVAAFGAFVALPSLAANTGATAGGVAYTLRTNTTGGSCYSFTDDDGSTTTGCNHGSNSITFNDVTGCSGGTGQGQCINGELPSNSYMTTTVTCPGGAQFIITNGNGDSSAQCTINHATGRTAPYPVTGGSCDNTSGSVHTNSSGEVDCSCNDNHGCCNTGGTGSGSCTPK